ncbi:MULTISPECIES: hypothetical protein [Mesobacillus]|uniref:hypothetical protein n=1 Tax=Mesobacillus TaxID=2675231 RepID=UPI001CF3FF87|nr:MULTISPECIES: hypothetical protein [Mesobacillus]
MEYRRYLVVIVKINPVTVRANISLMADPISEVHFIDENLILLAKFTTLLAKI